MSRKKLTVALLIPLIAMHCAKLGEASVSFSQQNTVAAQAIETGTNKPGMGSSGGPTTYSFWVKNRQATADALVGSFTPFYKVNATRLAVSANFVLYRDSLLSTLTISQATTVLATMETAYANLKSVYGAGQQPSANDNARIVILAFDILDDYSTTGNYVGGYFSPRDLYSNTFTTALYTDPVAIQQYSSLIAVLGGYSNEMSLINYDLSPGYSQSPAQVNDIVIHELSHLFTYNRRVIKERLVNHDLWIAEGIAENAPHQTIQTANVQQLRLTQLASPSTIDFYQDAPQLTDFTTWAPKVVGYIQSNLFFNYLRHRAEMNATGSAATMLAELMTTSDQTIAGLEAMLAKYIPGNSFSSIYGDYVLTNYSMFMGIPIGNVDAAAVAATRFNMANVQIGNSAPTTIVDGTTIKSKYPTDLAYNYEAPKCADGTSGLKPNSYIVFRHLVGSPSTTITPTDNAPAGQLKLKYVVNLANDLTLINTPPATLNLRTFDAGTTVDLTSAPYSFATNDYIQIIVYNANKSGNCLAFDANLIGKRNHSKWTSALGPGTQPSPDLEWQSDSGAAWNNSTNGAYYRPGGIASFAGGSYPNNFLYIVDYTNMSLQRLNTDSGTPLGRLGNTSTVCPTSGSGWDSGNSRYANNYCAHSFDSPQGAHADATGNIYVADSNNRRIVKYDSAGNFVGWIGLNGANCSNPVHTSQAACVAASATWTGQDGWQTSSFTDGNTLFNNGAQTDPKMFFLPWSLTSSGGKLYITDYGGHRIIRRDASTGYFEAYIGNGHGHGFSPCPTACACEAGTLGWNTSSASQTTIQGSKYGLFTYPRGISTDGTNLYVADELNNRIVRVNRASGQFTGWLGDGASTWQTFTCTTSTPVPSTAVKYFKNPSDVAVSGLYLYIADRLNNRIVKWKTDGTACNAVTPAAPDSYCGWLGHGKIRWERTQAAAANDPYGGVSYYPPDYYAEPHALTVGTAAGKGTRNDYLFYTTIFNGRVGRINIGCADNPISTNCTPSYNPFLP